MNEIDAKFPDTIFYSKLKDSVVKNDFYFTIETNCHIRKEIPERSPNPKIYIRGLEQLFSSSSAMNAFVKAFQASSNADYWNLTYGCFRTSQEQCLIATYCIDPEDPSIPENIFPVTFRSIQEKFHFTADFSKFSSINPINITVHFDNFDVFSPDFENQFDQFKPCTILVEEIAYILDFYAKKANDIKAPKTHAIHKGDEALIGWDLSNVQRISASLRDENGKEVGNLPLDHSEVIDKDKKFTLSIEKDGHVETRSLNVYRTLWEKVAEGKCPDGFTPDPKGNNKFFRRNYDSNYYTYIHPKLFRSANLVEWEEVSIQVCDKPPEKFNNYYCNYYHNKQSNTDEHLLICYTYDNIILLYDYDFDSKKLTEKNFFENHGWFSCQAIKKDDNIDFFSVDEIEVTNFDYLNKKPGFFFRGAEDSKIIAIDTLYDDRTFLAILCNNNHVYVYDTDNNRISNIFEFKNKNQKRIALVKTNSIYILLDDYVFELNDKEKFTDINFSPKNINEAPLIIGVRDKFTFSAITQNGEKIDIWNYKF